MDDAPGDPKPIDAQVGDLVAARLLKVEVAMLARVLTTTLAAVLPPSRVRVEHRRSLAEIVRRRPGVVVGVTIIGPDRTLMLRCTDVDAIETVVEHVVRGVTLSRREVSVPEWLTELGALLDRAAAQDDATRQALHRALLT